MAGTLNTSRVLVGQQMTYSSLSYLWKLYENGLFDRKPNGHAELSENAKVVIEALHTVLAGGEVDITVTQPGDPDTKQELDDALTLGIDDANAVNKAAGYYVTLTP